MSSEQGGDVTKRFTEFINTWPLYSPFEMVFDPPVNSPILPDRILRDCSTCEATPTWVRKNPEGLSNTPLSVGEGSVVEYLCTHCGQESIYLWFKQANTNSQGAGGTYPVTTRSVLRKLGQWPSQQNEPDREVSKALSQPLLDFFKKGLTSLNHGYGLGALAYFRRVVEDASTVLIDLFAERAAAEGDQAAADTIRAAKGAGHVEDRLRTAADALPTSLRPGGVNPLSVLYTHYSRGIHGLSDDECLVVAQRLYFAVEYIFKNWRKQMEDVAEFRRTVQRWSDPSKGPQQES
jgi:hypothetical protein